MKVYLDNAATTRPDPEVIESMMPYLTGHFGNPSSVHSFGRDTRSAIELARKKIAQLIGAAPTEIYFTSCGTEADNTALSGFVETYSITHVITTRIEHHAVLHTLDHLKKTKGINIIFLKTDASGAFGMQELEGTLADHPRALVTLMHANNEIGNLTDIEKVAELCLEYQAYFHSDTVQTLGKIPLNVGRLKLNSLAGSAHKFHGPKGIGFLYVNKSSKIGPYLHGGGQERNLRSGTENVAGIVGMSKALEIAINNLEKNRQYIMGLKSHMIHRLNAAIPGIGYNGLSGDLENSLATILNISLPSTAENEMLLFQLDLGQVAVSGGSACSSGAQAGSHVLDALGSDPHRQAIRFSFSKYNTKEEVDYAVDKLAELLAEGKTV